jgi:hypothetical protein
MKKILAIAAVALAFAPTSVSAQERVGHAALGAVSGAVVLGPVGAVAGGVIGYTAGPAIAHSWGVRRSEPRRRGQSARRSTGSATNGVPAISAPQQAPKEISARPAEAPVKSAVRPSAMAPVAPLE